MSKEQKISPRVKDTTRSVENSKQIPSPLKELLETYRRSLAQYNLEPRFDPKNSLVYFVNPDRGGSLASGLRVITLRNVRQPIFDKEGNLEGEAVCDSLDCVAIYVPPTKGQNYAEIPREEIKKQGYQQAARIKEEIIRLRSKFSPNISPESINIAVAFAGQCGLWEKLGMMFDEIIKPNLENSPYLLSIINTLFYNENFPSLFDIGVKFGTRGVTVPQIDIHFYTRDERGIAHPCGVTLWGWDKTLRNVIPYENVAGLIAVPNEYSLDQRKELQRRVKRLLGYWLKDPEVNVLTVDQNLVDFWGTKGALVKGETQDLPNPPPLRKRVDYGGKPNNPTSAKLVLFEPKAMVGGPQLLVDVGFNDSEVSSAVLLDWGLPYLDEALMSLGNRPSYINGLNPFLREGMLPEIRRLYRLDLLSQSLTPQMVNVVLTGNYSFILGELYHRGGWDYVADLINQKFPRKFNHQKLNDLKNRLEEIENKYYSDKRIFEEILISHAHTDHYGGLFSIRDEVPVGLSPETYALLNARFHQPGTWLDEHIIRRERENGLKNPYPLKKRPIHLYFPNGWERIAPHLSVAAFPLNHSIIGTLGFVIQITNNRNGALTHIAYLTDFREGPLTAAAIEAIKSIAPQLLIIEGTNIAGEKVSSGITEEEVKLNIKGFLEKAGGGFFIVQIPPNHLERLANIVEIKGRRKVAIPLQIAQILHEFYILNENLPEEQKINIPQIGTDVVVYYQQKMTYDPWEKQLIDQYQATDIFSLTSNPADFIIIASPYLLLENLFAGQLTKSENPQGYVINATYWPYSQQAKSTLLSNHRFAEDNNLFFISDVDLSRNTIQRPKGIVTGVHASGHASDEYLLWVISQMAQGGNLQTVLPIHTEFRGTYANLIKEELRKQGVAIYPEIEGLKIIERVKKQRAEIPIF